MKTRLIKLFTLLCVICPTLFSMPAFASEYFGEVCWLTVDEGEPQTSDNYLKLAFYHVGDNHFTVNGFAFSDNDQSVEERSLLTGNAEIFGDMVFFNMNGSSSNAEQMLALTVAARISLANLNGTFEGIGKIFDRGSQELGDGVQQGTLTFTECPPL